MNENTINNDVTMAGRASVLASRYRIVRQLGQGGMGSVWLAEDTQLDGKLFAIKMLPSILVANKRAYAQLKSEALVAMKLVHSNIVQIRAFEENNGNPFLVMDYIDGETLDDWLGDRGQELGVSEEDVVKLLKPIAEALDYAHTEGGVHRDVKPANVMIRKDGRPFIMDFGIAREIQETLTRVTGKLSSGTLLYMSPEQLNGDMPKKEQDVYSFAAMVYECLKGEPPFCRGVIEDQIKNKTPEVLGDNITVASSVMAGLAKKPENRPKTCADVLKVNSNTFQSFGKNWEGERPREMQSEQTVRAKSGGKAFDKIAAVALLALGLVGGVWYWQDAKEKDEARKQLEGVNFLQYVVKSGDSVGKIAYDHGITIKELKELNNIVYNNVRIGQILRVPIKSKCDGTSKLQSISNKKTDSAARGESRHPIAQSVSKVQLWEGGPYWADRNIGAEKPEDYGYYFWWGDTIGDKREGDKWVASDGSNSNFEFLNTLTCGKIDLELRSEGWITADGVLSPQHDAAQKHWGGNWRMPTKMELDDLVNKCDWRWIQVNGVNGYLVRGKGEYSSKSIFLPCAGYGCRTSLYSAGSNGRYWSSVPGSDYGRNSWYLYFLSGSHYSNYLYRFYGHSVRPLQGFTK